ncbi:FAD-dependent oxidoreductase [Verrucomicrobiota bacterium sgz303538]
MTLIPARADVTETDICVYGGTSGGVIAAVQAVRMGKSVVLISPTVHLGGMTSGGLGWTDLGTSGILGGLSREFYHRAWLYYQDASAWNWQARSQFGNAGQGGPALNDTTQTASVFEPKVAEQIFEGLITEHNVHVVRARLDLANGVVMDGKRIKAIRVEDGSEFRAKEFIDATYEGDLMARAGVTFTRGREPNSKYGETYNGIQANRATSNQLPNGIDPYIVPGNPASGLLPGVNADSGGTDGSGDDKIQAYCYRMVLTDVAANRIAVGKPDGYNEADYELLFRAITAGQTTGFFKLDLMPNRKTDSNNSGGISTDFIGRNYNWPESNYAEREQIAKAHENWQRGLVWSLQNHPRVPQSIRDAYAKWGLPADEFLDTDHWPHQIYVRESRRMVSDYVMVEKNCQGTIVAQDSVGLAAYTMDSHNTQRHVKSGVVKNEGDVQTGVPKPYPVSYRSIVPKASECPNLLVPWCLSASHIAYGSIRMEPVFMTLSQSAATAAAFAIDDEVAVQAVSYPKLKLQMLADGQVLTWGATDDGIGTTVDNTDTTGVTITGDWLASSSTAGYWGTDYLHDQAAGKGTKSVRFTPDLPAAGEYDVYLRWTSHTNRSSNVPVDVISATGTDTITVNQQQNGGIWFLLRRGQFTAGTAGSVLVRTTGTANGSYVVADAARWVPVSGAAPKVDIITTKLTTREGANDAARLTLLRPSTASTDALTINYALSGTAQLSDFNALSGTATFAAGASTATINIQAASDTLVEGTETVTVTLQPGTGYTVGDFSAATVRLLDRPIDAWRHTNFTATELANAAVSGETADPDSDGLSNLEEYALGLNPHVGDTSTVPTPQISADHLTLSYARLKSATDVNVVIEGSYDLTNWATTGVVERIAQDMDDNFERITVRLATPASQAGQGYLRLRVTR